MTSFKSFFSDDYSVELYNYKKYSNGFTSGKLTGRAVKLNTVDDIVVIDVDINHDYDEDKKKPIRDSFMEVLDKFNNIVVVKSVRGGLHIYTKGDGFKCGNRETKKFKSDDYDIDFYNSEVNKDKQNLVVLPNSEVVVEEKGRPKVQGKYELIKGAMDTVITDKAKDVFDSLKEADLIPISKIEEEKLSKLLHEIEAGTDKFAPLESTPTKSTPTKSNKNDVVTDAADFLDEGTDLETTDVKAYKDELLLIHGFEGLDIHNDGANRSIRDEITLFTLFPALNALPPKVIDYAYEYIKTKGKLTNSAETKWDSARTRYMWKKGSSFTLAKMLKIHNPSYYESKLKFIYEKPIEVKPISRNDKLTFDEFVRKCMHDEYKTPNDVVTDMLRIMRVYGKEVTYWMVKKDDILWAPSSKENIHQFLRTCRACGTNLWDIYKNHLDLFRIAGVKFNDPSSNVLNLFQGYKYAPVENAELLSTWTDFVKTIICNNNELMYNYVQNWISFIIRNPGKKTGTALILKGPQGIGKGTFADVLSKLLDGYVSPNITNMDELTGSFNTAIEGMTLCFCNELKNVGEERVANFDGLKSLITDYRIRYNEKGIPRRTGENVANFVFMTNNAYPVKIEVDDRRYVVLEVNDAKRGDYDYWTKFNAEIDRDDFIQAIMYDYVNNYDDSYKIREIPNTEGRKDLINASKSPIVTMIEEHYSAFVNGTIVYDTWIPVGMKKNTFCIQLAKYCNKKTSKKRDYTRDKIVYTLKPLYVKLLDNKSIDDEDVDGTNEATEFVDEEAFDHMDNHKSDEPKSSTSNEAKSATECNSTNVTTDTTASDATTESQRTAKPKSPIVTMIEEHYLAFCNGTVVDDTWKPEGMNKTTFGLEMSNYCNKHLSRKGETRGKMIYTLKPEYVESLKPKENAN